MASPSPQCRSLHKLLLLLVVTLASGGLAQTLYIPLDNRPPNWTPCTWGVVQCPPAEFYKGRSGVGFLDLSTWLINTPGQRLVVSLDALAYGGLVQSREASLPAHQALARLAVLRAWKGKFGGEVVAFGVIPRHPDAKHRERNLEVLRSLEGWGLDYLEAPWDDALPGSPAVQEAATLPLPTRPGADESGQLMLLRTLSPGLRVRVWYDDPAATGQNTPYEGIPLEESVRRLLKSGGMQAVEQKPDLALLVYTGKDPRQAVLTLLQASREAPVAVADIASVNRGDKRLMDYLLGIGHYPNLASYACWGTPANNLGSALAQGGLFLRDLEGRLDRLAEGYLQYLYGEVGRPWVRRYFVEPLLEGVSILTLGHLREQRLPSLMGDRLELLSVEFPWRRSFEIALRFRRVR